jgi:hypothetical protein
LAHYIFADCQVIVDDSAYRPILEKLDTPYKVSVLLIANRTEEVQLPVEETTNVQAREQ